MCSGSVGGRGADVKGRRIEEDLKRVAGTLRPEVAIVELPDVPGDDRGPTPHFRARQDLTARGVPGTGTTPDVSLGQGRPQGRGRGRCRT